MSVIDVEIGRLLGSWEPTIGRPTCRPGCSGCCERTTVIVTSPEALALVRDAPEFTDAVDSAVSRLSPVADLNELLDLGPCVYLADGECQAYDSRPDACRACYVWHDSRYCGRQDFDMCTPAELNQLRLQHMSERMLEEFARGRHPFRGYLLPAVWLMSRRFDDYVAGADLRATLAERWTRTDLLEFPTEEALRRERSDFEELFRDEFNPMGFPRAARARDSRLLEAFDLRP